MQIVMKSLKNTMDASVQQNLAIIIIINFHASLFTVLGKFTVTIKILIHLITVLIMCVTSFKLSYE